MKAVSPITKESSVKQNITKTAAIANASIEETTETEVFAPTVENERRGRWFGGIAPHNKRASGIETYYRIKAEEKANHLTMTLRFEGISSEDAKVDFRVIDGAKFKQIDQRTHWRLKPNIASEVIIPLVVPDGISYLTLDSSQNNKGSSRAFVLNIPDRK